MELIELASRPHTIFETLFIDMKRVSEYETLEKFEENNEKLYWQFINLMHDKGFLGDNGMVDDRVYHTKSVDYPEFSKIVQITIAVIERKINGGMGRMIEKIPGENEKEILQNFFGLVSSMGNGDEKKYLCGHRISSHIIPFLAKRGLKNETQLPMLVKKPLFSKPWDSGLIDTSLIWKFNSHAVSELDFIMDFLDLKVNVKLRPYETISGYYYNSLAGDGNLDWLVKQGANEVNLLMQLMKKIRNL